ncbi:MAG: type I restriction enzyme HsdR N-terminal domain-containing protein [Bacteroidales bacterium]|nr:type I restriction enzyme HsdR N-terminal domain-containing protein [Porphyromonas sp.]MDD6935203.1 type I restriction enzyme HsdR N-terminal domain-containing protein [Bacteroidales bacterium]MDY3102432.1 type I restriction enzyme HsdR N-terminal domain-containing protein [Porphyromonas sp.]
MCKDNANVLNLPAYRAIITEEKGKKVIFDDIRNKNVALTPEEWVRQHFVHYLRECLGYPRACFSVETKIVGKHTAQRTDTIVYGVGGIPWIVVEYKAAHLDLTSEMWQQVCRYNLTYKAAHLVLTNGRQQIVCRIDYGTGAYQFLDEVPSYASLRRFYDTFKTNNE